MPFSNFSARGQYADFTVHGVDRAVVNALRRAILADVPTAAIPYNPEAAALHDGKGGIKVHTNTSVLHNEFLGHRLSLVPIHFSEEESLDIMRGTKAYEFVVDVKNDGIVPIDVTTADFTGSMNGEPLSKDDLARLFPADPVTNDHILLVRLKPGSGGDSNYGAEHVHIVCQPCMGTGKEHARWVPTSLCAFGNTVDNAKAAAVLEEEVARALKSNATDEEIKRIKHDFQCMGRHRCFVVDAHGEPAEFTFKLRSECGLTPAYIIFKALSILAERTRKFANSIAMAAPADGDAGSGGGGAVLESFANVPGMHQFIVDGEDHTLGNLVQSLLFNKFIRNQATGQAKAMEYVGYHQPHPDEHRIILRVKLDASSPMKPQEYVSACVQSIADDLDALVLEWIEFSRLMAANLREVTEVTSKIALTKQPSSNAEEEDVAAAKAKKKRAPAPRKKVTRPVDSPE